MLVRDTWNTDILPELAPRPDDIVLYKHRYSGFYETDLGEILKSFSVQYLIFTGCTTSVCDDAKGFAINDPRTQFTYGKAARLGGTVAAPGPCSVELAGCLRGLDAPPGHGGNLEWSVGQGAPLRYVCG